MSQVCLLLLHVTLPNLRSFSLRAVSAYSEVVLSWITAPHFEDFQICYHKQLTFSVSQLLQFMGRRENLRFDHATFVFLSERVYVGVNHPETDTPDDAFSLNVDCWHLDWQVSSVVQIFNALSQILHGGASHWVEGIWRGMLKVKVVAMRMEGRLQGCGKQCQCRQ
jgi:hypothetical protein